MLKKWLLRKIKKYGIFPITLSIFSIIFYGYIFSDIIARSCR